MYIHPLGSSKVFIKKEIIDLNKPFDGANLTTEIKCVEKDFHAQAYKYLKGLELTENDFKAMKDDYIITYNEKYEFSLS